MKKLFSSLAIGFLTLIASGCTPNVKYILITPADALLMDCQYVVPVDQINYIRKELWTDREEILIKKLSEGNSNMQKCNLRLKEIREWKLKQQELWEKDNANQSSPVADPR